MAAELRDQLAKVRNEIDGKGYEECSVCFGRGTISPLHASWIHLRCSACEGSRKGNSRPIPENLERVEKWLFSKQCVKSQYRGLSLAHDKPGREVEWLHEEECLENDVERVIHQVIVANAVGPDTDEVDVRAAIQAYRKMKEKDK